MVDENFKKNLAVKTKEPINNYKEVINKLYEFISKVGEDLILDFLRLETQKSDWMGNTTFELPYKNKDVNLKEKMEVDIANSICFQWGKMKGLYVLKQKDALRGYKRIDR